MPELAEVEFGRKIAERVGRGRRIASVRCDEDPIVYAGVTPERFAAALTGRRVEAVRRHGKQLWFELDERPWPLFHFGMTGAFVVPGGDALALASTKKGGEPERWPPRFAKVHLVFDDGGELVMTNKRRLGRIRLQGDPPSEKPLKELGFDPLLDLPSAAAFRALARRRRVVIKALLLDQKFSAGVGNWLADEVLYHARIDPRRRVPDLTDAELERIRKKLGAIVAKAVAVDGRKAAFPRTWLFHHRWGKTEGAKTARGEAIEHATVAGRTTAWVPSRQS